MTLRPRFSLRTLLLTVLTLAAAVTLWQNFAPWRLTCVFPLDFKHFLQADLSRDAKWILVSRYNEPGKSEQYDYVLFNTQTGQQTPVFTLSSNIRKPSYRFRFARFSPDSSRVVIGLLLPGAAPQFRLFDVNAQKEITLPKGEANDIKNADFSASGRYLLLHSHEGPSRWVDLETLNNVGAVPAKSSPLFSKAGDQVVAAFPNNSLRLFDTASGRELRRLSFPAEFNITNINYFSRNYLSAYIEDKVTPTKKPEPRMLFYKLNVSEQPEILDGFLSWVINDEFALLEVQPKRIHILKLPGCSKIGEIELPFSYAAHDPALVCDNTRLFTMPWGLYDLSTGKKTFVTPENDAVLSPDHQRYLLSGGIDNPLTLRSVHTNTIFQTFEGERTASFLDTVFSSDGQRFLTSNSKQKSLHLWTRHRPEPWYGLACLPEFWLTLLLAPATLWSLLQDRKK